MLFRSNPETSYNLGGAFFSQNQMDSAIVYFSRCIQINDNTRIQNPKFQYTANYEQAKSGLNAAYQAKQAQQQAQQIQQVIIPKP